MRSIEAQKNSPEKPRSGKLDLTRKMETGIPSPASDHLEKALSLEDLVVFRPSSTFYVRAEGKAMEKSGIHHRDILIVDRSISAKHGCIIITSIDQEPCVRRLIRQGSRIFLVSDDTHLKPIAVNHETDWTIWGVVTHVIHRFITNPTSK